MAFDLNEKMAGVQREVTFKVTPHGQTPINEVKRIIDYSSMTLQEVLALADATVIIKMQRSLRNEKPEKIRENNGALVDAKDSGKAPESPSDLIGKLKAMGLTPEQIAEMMKA